MPCVCGLPGDLETCCGRYLSGMEAAPTAEALMRSRYAAYATGNVDYVLATHDPATVKAVDRKTVADWAREAQWDELEVVSTEAGTADDAHGFVEFVARYRMHGEPHTHHERSSFRRVQGRWYFTAGRIVKPPPVVRETPRVGRNDPCPCGSGKKAKKCCLA